VLLRILRLTKVTQGITSQQAATVSATSPPSVGFTTNDINAEHPQIASFESKAQLTGDPYEGYLSVASGNAGWLQVVNMVAGVIRGILPSSSGLNSPNTLGVILPVD